MVFPLKNKTIRYSFKEDSIIISPDITLSFQEKYDVLKNVLKIGEYQSYSIDFANDTILILTEIPTQQLPDDKINRLYFLNGKYYFNYLVDKNLIEINGDSLIKANDLLTPYFEKEPIDKYFMNKLNFININGIISGNLTLSPNGTITSLNIINSNGFSKKQVDLFKNILQSTNGSWTLPYSLKKYFVVDFSCRFENVTYRFSISFLFHTPNPEKFYDTGLTIQEIESAENSFNKGIKLLQTNKFEKAIVEFTKCIEIDSTYLDAYYNKAYAYYKMDDQKSACEIWSKLKDWEQKAAESLFNENCY